MWNELKLIQQVNIAQTYNKIIFYLQKFPFLGKKVPNRFFHAEKFKNIISIVGGIGFVLGQFLTKAIYFFILYILSFFILANGLTNAQGISAIFSTLLFFYSVIAGTFFKIKQIDPADSFDLLFIKQLNMEPKKYYHAQMLLSYGMFFISYSISLAVILYFNDMPVIHALSFTLLLIGLRLLIQIFYIYSFQADKPSPERSYTIIALIAIIIGFGLAPLYGFGLIQPPIPSFFNLGSLFVGLLLIAVAVPILRNTNKYKDIVRTALTSERIQEIQSAIQNAASLEVQLNDNELTEDNYTQVETHATGITYINELFFARLGHLLNKRVRTSVIILSILFLVIIGVLLGIDYFQVATFTAAQVEAAFSSFWHIAVIYISSLAYMGEHFTKFCFYNMDRMLMKNNYYRQPEFLLEAIWIRFKISIRYNFPIFIVISAGTLLTYFVAGGQSLPVLLLALLSNFVLMLFFSVHFLFLYYLIQPYTENMENKSPIYTLATFLTFYAPVILLQNISSISQVIVFIIYGFIIIYLIVGLLAVIKLAPKRFKLR